MNLVTGATGLLGSHICEQLIRRGHAVRAIVRKGSDKRFLESLSVECVTGDITDPASLVPAMADVDVVYHAAARVGDWGPWSDFVAVSIQGTANVLEAAARAGVKRFLHVSSISAYGQVDGAGTVLDETAPLGRNVHRWSYYTRAKVEAERLVWAAHARGDIPVTVCRPSWLYGPRDRVSMPRLIKAIQNRKAKILGDGENLLSLTYAGNEAEGCILAATSERAIGQGYNLSNDGPITQREYYNKIAAAVGAEPVTRRVPYKVAYGAGFTMECLGRLLRMKRPPFVTRYAAWLLGRRIYFSCEKARTQLGWQPTVGYDEGIERAVAFCMDAGSV